jgi:hypothetical protein
MEIGELVAKWEQQVTDYRALNATVNAAALSQRFLDELRLLETEDTDTWLSVSEAVDYSGYTEQSIRRMIRQRRLDSKGKGKSRLVLKSGLPRRLPGVAAALPCPHLLAAKAEQTVRESVGAS